MLCSVKCLNAQLWNLFRKKRAWDYPNKLQEGLMGPPCPACKLPQHYSERIFVLPSSALGTEGLIIISINLNGSMLIVLKNAEVSEEHEGEAVCVAFFSRRLCRTCSKYEYRKEIKLLLFGVLLAVTDYLSNNKIKY